MRCIEITFFCCHIYFSVLINYNMRCIEIPGSWREGYVPSSINYNMRCIEMEVKGKDERLDDDKLQHEMY